MPAAAPGLVSTESSKAPAVHNEPTDGHPQRGRQLDEDSFTCTEKGWALVTGVINYHVGKGGPFFVAGQRVLDHAPLARRSEVFVAAKGFPWAQKLPIHS